MQAFQWEDRDQQTPHYVHMIAGSSAGIVEHISMLPVDILKTHCQAGSKLQLKQIVKNVYKTGGLTNFYSGTAVLVLGCAPAHAIYFTIYEHSKIFLNCESQSHSLKFALVGAVSALFHDLIMTPTEVVKQRLQLIRSQSAKIQASQLIKHMYKTEGKAAFYRSFPINFAMNVPFGSIVVLLNETLKKIFKVSDSKDKFWNYYLCGGVAGALASIPTCPFDVIKTKLNTQTCLNSQCEKKNRCDSLREGKQKAHQIKVNQKNCSTFAKNVQQNIVTLKPVQIKYKHIIGTAKTVWLEEGAIGFFNGIKMRMAIQSFSSAMGWGTYQILKAALMPKNLH